MQQYKTLFVTQRGHRHQQAALDAAPPELQITMRRTADKQEVIGLLPDMDFLISERTGTIDDDVIAAGKKLKLIQRLGSQTWDIDSEAARRAKIPVCYMPVLSCIMVAEHMILQMMVLGRRLREVLALAEAGRDWGMPPKRCNEDYFAFNWTKRTDVRSLSNKTIGILGFGEIATEMVLRLKGYNCRILYTKRRPLPAAVEKELGLAHATPDQVAAQSDYVCCLLPNLPENNQSIGAEFFARMKRGALFAHCGAPGVVNEDALIAALRSGQIGGAALDCFTYEPMRQDDPLLEVARDPASNLILTPHIAAGTVAANRDERVGDFRNLLAVVKGETLQHRVV